MTIAQAAAFALPVTVPPGVLRLAAYLRLSKKKGGGDEVDTETQLEDCHKEAAYRGGVIVKVYIENDTSAFIQKEVKLPDGRMGLRNTRPVFQTLYGDLYDGTEIDGMVGYHLDRIARQPRDLEDLIDLVEMRKVKVFGVASDIDLTTDMGITAARMLVNFANLSSRDTRRRVTRKWASIQEKGQPGGGPRPFGFTEDRVTHDPIEAAAIRKAVEDITNGGTIAGVVRGWQEAGLTSTLGNQWTSPSLKALLKSPRIAGIRARRINAGWEFVRKADGTVVPAVWQPIVSREQWEALQVILDRNTATHKHGGRSVRKFLLSGITRCGACGGRMTAQPATGKNRSHSYICPSPINGGCGKVARHGGKVDAFVREAVKTAILANLSTEHAEPVVWARGAELELIESQLEEAHARWRAGSLPGNEYWPIRDELKADEKALLDERAAFNAAHPVTPIPVNLAETWEDAPLAEQRAIIERFVSAVVILPLPVVDGRKVKRWDATLIEVEPVQRGA